MDIVAEIGGVELTKSHNLSAPKGVNGRNSDNELIRKCLDWEPKTPLRDGLEVTYQWIAAEYAKAHGLDPDAFTAP